VGVAGIGVLGPLTVNGAAAGLAPRDRVVLAALALRPGKVVSAERLADALWGERPPPSWSKVVPGCVMRLRRILGTEAIETLPHGYRLVMAGDATDARRFERLVGRSRELLTLGEPDRAAHLLGEALGLWRGQALIDLERCEAGRLEAARLEQLRLDAEELRLDAALLVGRYREVLGEVQARVAEAPLRERRWALLALAQYQAGRQGEALLTLHRARTMLATELGIDPGPDLVALEQAILRQDPSLAAPLLPEPSATCPYLGLVSYDVGDSDTFFGRDAEVAACLGRLATTRVLAVVGPSGSGKSSLVRAGVAASLQRDGRQVVIVTPGAHPMDALTTIPASGPGPVLVVDQCEQAVSLCRDAAEQSGFFAALADRAERAPLIVALRADRLGDVSAHPRFARLLERGLQLLGPMAEADLRAAIEGPAHLAGLLLEPGLVDLLVREVEGEPGALPLLSHALRQTWERREGRTLTVAGYQATGGIRGAVARSAEDVYERVPPDQRPLLRDLLLRLVAPTADGEPVPSPVPRRTLATDPDHEHLIDLLVDARLVTSDDGVIELSHESLAQAWPRLRGWLDDDIEGQRVLRHLVGSADAWDALGRADSELYRGIRLTRALQWQQRTNPRLTPTEQAFLDASRELAEVELTAARRRRRLLVSVLSSALAVAVGLAAFAMIQRRDAQREARNATVRELAGESALALEEDPELSMLLALQAVDTARSAGDQVAPEVIGALQRAVEASRLELRMDDGYVNVAFSPDGTIMATDSTHQPDVVIWDARNAQRLRTLTAAGERVGGVAFGPDGTLLAASYVNTTKEGSQRAIVLWDPETSREAARLMGPAREYGPPAFSPDGRLVAAPSSRTGTPGRVTVWDVASGRRLYSFEPAGDAYRVEFLPTGSSMVVTEPNAHRIGVYAATDGHQIGSLDTADFVPWFLSVSPTGERLAVASQDSDAAQVWDLTTGNLLRSVEVGTPNAIDWSPDGHLLAIAELAGSVRIIDPATGQDVMALRGSDSSVGGLAFAPNGTRLASVSIAGELLIWDVTADGPPELGTRAVESGRPEVWSISPNGKEVGVSTNRGTFERLDADTGEALGSLTGQIVQYGFFEVVPSPDWRLVASVATDGTAAVRDMASFTTVFKLPPCTSPKAFSPDGSLLVLDARSPCTVFAGSGDPPFDAPPGTDLRSRVIDLASGRVVLDLGETPIFVAVFNPDGLFSAGRYLAVGALDGLRLYDVTTGQLLATGDPDALTPSFDAQGRLLAWGTRTGLAQVVDVSRIVDGATTDEATVFKVAAHNGSVDKPVLTDDGLLATRAETLLRVWDVATGDLVVEMPMAPDVSSRRLTVGPNGSYVLYAEGSVLRKYYIDHDRLIELARNRLTRGFSADECHRYLDSAECP
jgi:WD40 repeat protein/DNA-binding SARP family transcriptional activator